MAWLALALLAVVGLGLIAATIVVSQRAASAIEEHTRNAFGVPARLDRALVSLPTGHFWFTGLHLENPEGFDAPEVMVIGGTEGRVRLTTIFDEVVELARLTISDTELHLERRDGSGNYERILDHYLRVGHEVGDPDLRYVIRELVLEDVVVHLDLFPDVEEARHVPVPIDELRLTDVGTEADGGLMLQEVAGVVVQALFAAVLERAGEELPGVVARELADRLIRARGLEGILDGEALLEALEVLVPGLRPGTPRDPPHPD